VGDRVIFKGTVTNVVEYLECSDMLVMPSLSEALPIAAIEAACAGLPLLVSDIAPFDEFVGPATIRCGTGSATALSDGFLAMHGDLVKYKEHARRICEEYRGRFSIDATARLHMALYEKLVENEELIRPS
jgi:glycosyltransferase involved in cell wall biosynthesis